MQTFLYTTQDTQKIIISNDTGFVASKYLYPLGSRIRVRAIGGGGGGSDGIDGNGGGGGGAGVFYSSEYILNSSGEIPYSVGNGGNGGIYNSPIFTADGQPTIFTINNLKTILDGGKAGTVDGNGGNSGDCKGGLIGNITNMDGQNGNSDLNCASGGGVGLNGTNISGKGGDGSVAINNPGSIAKGGGYATSKPSSAFLGGGGGAGGGKGAGGGGGGGGGDGSPNVTITPGKGGSGSDGGEDGKDPIFSDTHYYYYAGTGGNAAANTGAGGGGIGDGQADSLNPPRGGNGGSGFFEVTILDYSKEYPKRITIPQCSCMVSLLKTTKNYIVRWNNNLQYGITESFIKNGTLFSMVPTHNPGDYSVTCSFENEVLYFVISIVGTLNILCLNKKKLVVSSPSQVYIKIGNEKIKLKGCNNVYKHNFCDKIDKIKIYNEIDYLRLFVY